MRLHYLDDYRENGSLAILSQLGINYLANALDDSPSVNCPVSWNNEHNHKLPVKYVVNKGQLIIDIRDSADCWIRCYLNASEGLTIPANVSRRLTHLVDNEKCEFSADITGEIFARFNNERDSVRLNVYHNYRDLVCELCQQFFRSGWVTGTGGSISIRHGNRIYMTPSGVQKERILPDELFVLDIKGNKLHTPERKPGTARAPVLSDCAALFLHAFQQRNAGAVLHSHGMSCALATCLYEGQSEFKISHQEMIKGITGHGYFDELVVPIIENTAWEHELSDLLGETIAKYPKAVAVLVRRHGMYVWGDTWEAAKRHAECLHYLFDIAINMRRMGIDLLAPPPPVAGAVVPHVSGSCQRNGMECSAKPATDNKLAGLMNIVLDIEGTTTPITFVKDVLFPYASNHVVSYLTDSWTSSNTIADIAALRKLAAEDGEAGVAVVQAIDTQAANVVSVVASYVQSLISADRKVTALKQLQGHMWEGGYKNGELKSIVYDDVPLFFQHVSHIHKSVDGGLRLNIYSSGSRSAQRLLFQYTEHGNLCKHISSYFDTTCGNKRSSESYQDILLSLGVVDATTVLFVTDVFEEAVAAESAGLKAILIVRPGNAPLPDGCTIKTINSFAELM